MFYNNIDPVLLSLGPLEIRYYGLVYVIGFLLGYFVLEHYRKKKDLRLSKDDIYDLMIYIIIGVVVGSRMVHVLFWNPMYYLSKPWEVLFLWQGGMAFHGGLIGIIFAGWLFAKRKKVSVWKIADILSVPALFALALGRLANFTNHELYGPVTSQSWCVVFQGTEGCRHPYQIYSFLKRTVVVGWLAWLMSMKKFKDGFVFWNFVLWVNVGRFVIDFWREDVRWLGLAAGQYFAFILSVVGIVVLVKYYRKDVKRLFF